MALQQSEDVPGKDSGLLPSISGGDLQDYETPEYSATQQGELRPEEWPLQGRNGKHTLSLDDYQRQVLELRGNGKIGNSPQERESSRQSSGKPTGALRNLSQQIDKNSLVGEAKKLIVVTDPPYGIGESSAKNSTRGRASAMIPRAYVHDYGDYHWDKKLDRAYIDGLLQCSKDQVIFGGNYYADWLPASSSWIVWDKLNSGDFADCELAWTSHKKAVRKFAYMWNGMIKQVPEERYHPTQKPLILMKWVIENYTQPGDTILDPFMGSGTTGVACMMTGRNFIGCEIDPTYFEIARRRIALAEMQPRLEGI
jgi:hypothetical protein